MKELLPHALTEPLVRSTTQCSNPAATELTFVSAGGTFVPNPEPHAINEPANEGKEANMQPTTSSSLHRCQCNVIAQPV